MNLHATSPHFNWHTTFSEIVVDDNDDMLAYSTVGVMPGFAFRSSQNAATCVEMKKGSVMSSWQIVDDSETRNSLTDT